MEKNSVKKQWSRSHKERSDRGRHVSDEVDQINGEWSRLIRKLREKYGDPMNEIATPAYVMDKSAKKLKTG